MNISSCDLVPGIATTKSLSCNRGPEYWIGSCWIEFITLSGGSAETSPASRIDWLKSNAVRRHRSFFAWCSHVEIPKVPKAKHVFAWPWDMHKFALKHSACKEWPFNRFHSFQCLKQLWIVKRWDELQQCWHTYFVRSGLFAHLGHPIDALPAFDQSRARKLQPLLAKLACGKTGMSSDPLWILRSW